jgi:hypothetical protein
VSAESFGAERFRVVEDGGAVVFVDALLVRWHVTERDARGDPGARAPRCLVFASPESIRRVWNFPAGWRDLDSAALAALSWGR